MKDVLTRLFSFFKSLFFHLSLHIHIGAGKRDKFQKDIDPSVTDSKEV